MKFKRRKISRKGGIQKGVYILPNLCTTASLFCGFFSVVKVLHGEYVDAAWAILLAGIFDLFDGQIARLTKSGSQFGIEYDSLVDLASFGFAPSLLVYMWALRDFERVGWLVSFLFFACGALRLARYNVQAEAEELKFFQGLPIPMAAYVIATTVLFYSHQYRFAPTENYWILFGTLLLSLLMVSNVRYRNAKEIQRRKKIAFSVLVGLASGIALIAIKPQMMMWILSLAYVSSGVLEEFFVFFHHGRRWKSLEAEGAKQNETSKSNLRMISPSSIEQRKM